MLLRGLPVWPNPNSLLFKVLGVVFPQDMGQRVIDRAFELVTVGCLDGRRCAPGFRGASRAVEHEFEGGSAVGLSPMAFITNTQPQWLQPRWLKVDESHGNN
jgi:hypothetical protein